jgi:hypothetical protein
MVSIYMTVNPNIDRLAFNLSLASDALLIISLLLYLFVVKLKSIVIGGFNVIILAATLTVRVWNIILQQTIDV